MNNAPLGSISKINPRKPQALASDALCSFIPMEYVDDVSGTIIQTASRQVQEVEKGYTYFENGDVLFAKITPCMENGKCALAKELINGIGFGSTEFHVIRAGEEVSPEWVYYFLRQEKIRQKAAQQMTGSVGQQRVPSQFLEGVMIPLPPLKEQQRITAILERANHLRHLRRFAREMSDTYLQSVFLEMFGDSGENSAKWPLLRLGHFVTINPRFSRTIKDPTRQVSFVPMAAINADRAEIVGIEMKTYAEVCKGFTAFEENDVLFAKITPCMENGKIVMAKNLHDGFGFGSTEFHILRSREGSTPEWLLWLLRRPEFRKQAQQAFTGTAGQQRVPASFLEDYKISVPPLPLQQRFAEIVQHFERLRARQAEAERQAEHLFQTLLDRAFTGEL